MFLIGQSDLALFRQLNAEDQLIIYDTERVNNRIKSRPNLRDRFIPSKKGCRVLGHKSVLNKPILDREPDYKNPANLVIPLYDVIARVN